MRIFAGWIGEGRTVASDWTPHSALANSSGLVKAEFVWAALDCPGGWAAIIDTEPKPVVLGRISARMDRVVQAGSAHVVTAWKIASEGRKHVVGLAIFDRQGTLCAVAKGHMVRDRREGLDVGLHRTEPTAVRSTIEPGRSSGLRRPQISRVRRNLLVSDHDCGELARAVSFKTRVRESCRLAAVKRKERANGNPRDVPVPLCRERERRD
jgi:hypothetical protein